MSYLRLLSVDVNVDDFTVRKTSTTILHSLLVVSCLINLNIWLNGTCS